MQSIFAGDTKIGYWLRVEKAVLKAQTQLGIAPQDAYTSLEAVESVDAQAVRDREAEIHHDLAAFVDVLGAQVPDAAAWIHYGLTSSDVVDTAQALQIGDAGSELLGSLIEARCAVLKLAWQHKDTAMMGRTHGMPAEPISFGAKLGGWWHQLGRDERRLRDALSECAVGKLSGAVGTYSQLSPEVEESVLAHLGLERDDSATQIIQRDRHAALLGAMAICAGTLDRCALEIRLLQRPEAGELAEPFGTSQKGSSAMPHKRNPIVAERICGLARVVRANAQVGFENIGLWHERDISHSSAERVVISQSFALLDYMLDRFRWMIAGLRVDAERMASNLADQRGLIASQSALLTLARHEVPRDVAYRLVQAASSDVISGESDNLEAALNVRLESAEIADEIKIEVLENVRAGQHPSGVEIAFSRMDPAPS